MKSLVMLLIILTSAIYLPAQKFKTENVILITFDGLRWQELFSGADSSLLNDKEYTKGRENLVQKFWDNDPEIRRKKLFPFFWSAIYEKGQLMGNRNYDNKVDLTNKFWFSYPGYNELLTGFADPEVDSNDKKNNKNITILEYSHQQNKFKGKVAAFGSWDVFPYIINTERSGIKVNAGFEPVSGPDLSNKEKLLNELLPQVPSPWGSVRFDAFTHHYAMEHLKKHKPKLLYIAFGETDDFAHDGSYDHYLNSAHQTDAFIKEIWEFVQSNDQYKNKTTLVIATDHGRGTNPKETWMHHGDEIDGSGQVWLMAIGPDTKAKGEIKTPGQYYQNQIASTIAELLKLDFKPTTDGVKAIAEVTGK